MLHICEGTSPAAAHWIAMAVTLLGYFSTMVATLVAFMMILNNVLSSGMVERAHHRPYPYPVVAEAAAPDNRQAAATDQQTGASGPVIADKANTSSQMAAVAPVTAKQTVPARNQRSKLALNQSHKEDLAGRQQDHEYSLASGYAQETQRQPGPLFDLFGPRRF
jgi:hypothetical protein